MKYSTYAELVIEKDRQSESVSSSYKQRFFVFSAGEYAEVSDVLNDLGYIKPMMCCEEISCAVCSLSAGQKYKLLTEHYKLSVDFPFPRVFHCGCNRSFQYKWLEKYA